MRNELSKIFSHPDKIKYEKYIQRHVDGKKCLDVGCVQHDAEAENSEGWTHSLIKQDAEDILGIDILEDEIAVLAEKGYNVKKADAQDFDLDEEFDVVFLGELIEHLTNICGLFNSIERHLKEDGVIIITTPNALSVYWSLRRIFGKSVNSEHTCWFDEQTLSQLLRRFGFEPVQTHHVRMSRLRGVRSVSAALGWLVEIALPAPISNRNLVVVAKSSD